MTTSLAIALIGVFVAVALGMATIVLRLVESRSASSRRLRDLLRAPTVTVASSESQLLGGSTPEVVQRLSRFLPKSPQEMGRLRRRLASAGLHGARPLLTYIAAELVLAAIGFLVPMSMMGQVRGLIIALACAVVGYLVPSFYLGYRVRLRKKLIDNGLPDGLDLLIVCLEAGLGLDQAILKSADELELAHPALAEELKMVNVECRAGKPRIDAFKNFATRTKVDDVRALVAMLVQTDRFGTSVAQALRTHAEVSRTKRRQRAEERAAKIGVKLVFPLVFFLFPAFYVVTLGPAIVKFVHALAPGGALSGGF